MADIIPPGFIEVTVPLRHTGLSRSAAVVFGVEDGIGGGDPDALATTIQGLFVTHVGARIDSDVRIGPTRIAVGQDGQDPIMGFAEVDAPGGRSLDSIAPILALRVAKRTTRGGRRGRGNMYIPWSIPDNRVNEVGTVDPAESVPWQNAMNAWRVASAGGDLSLVLLHSPGISPPGDPDYITNLTVMGTISHQVRRQPRL